VKILACNLRAGDLYSRRRLTVGRVGKLAGGQVEGVPAGDVGREPAESLGATGVLPGSGELLSTGCWSGVSNSFSNSAKVYLPKLSVQPSQPPCPASMYMAMLGKLSCFRA
jgi:hypothetical protein